MKRIFACTSFQGIHKFSLYSVNHCETCIIYIILTVKSMLSVDYGIISQ